MPFSRQLVQSFRQCTCHTFENVIPLFHRLLLPLYQYHYQYQYEYQYHHVCFVTGPCFILMYNNSPWFVANIIKPVPFH